MESTMHSELDIGFVALNQDENEAPPDWKPHREEYGMLARRIAVLGGLSFATTALLARRCVRVDFSLNATECAACFRGGLSGKSFKRAMREARCEGLLKRRQGVKQNGQWSFAQDEITIAANMSDVRVAGDWFGDVSGSGSWEPRYTYKEVAVLVFVAASPDGVGLAQIAKRFGSVRQTARGICSRLEQTGGLINIGSPRSPVYVLGARPKLQNGAHGRVKKGARGNDRTEPTANSKTGPAEKFKKVPTHTEHRSNPPRTPAAPASDCQEEVPISNQELAIRLLAASEESDGHKLVGEARAKALRFLEHVAYDTFGSDAPVSARPHSNSPGHLSTH